MPTWNRRKIIGRAIESVALQKYSNIELLVIDDGSIDGTSGLFYDEAFGCRVGRGIIKYFKRPRRGVSEARNYGLSVAKGEIIAYLDSDNEWHPDYCAEILRAYGKNAESDAVYTAMEIKSGDGVGDCVLYRNYDRVDMLYQNYIDMNCFSHRRCLIDKYGGFSDQMTRLVDWELVLRFTKAKPPLALKKVLAIYYTDRSSNRITNHESLKQNLKILIEKNITEVMMTKIPKLLLEPCRDLIIGTSRQPEWHQLWRDIMSELTVSLPK